MFIKFANADVLQAEIARPGNSLMRTAHRHSFDYQPREGFLYVRSRAISSRTNDNFDTFPAEEIKKAWATFVGKPVFVNHHNDDHRRARGVIIDAALHEDTAPDGTADTWVEVLMEIDAINFPKLAAAILAGDIERTSMGCDVAHSTCSACGNKASTPLEYCKHIPRMKGKRIRRKTASGDGTEDVLVHEICAGLSFFENSVLVEPPADPTAYFLGVDDRGVTGMAKSASRSSIKAHGSDGEIKYSVRYKNRADSHVEIEDGQGIVEATLGGQYVGSLIWDYLTDPPEVLSVVVEPAHQRRGIATKLWEIARQNESRLSHSVALTDEGRSWTRSLDVSAKKDTTPSEDKGNTTDRGYGWDHQKKREELLKDNPKCHWCKSAPATEADHHNNGLVPSCSKCNNERSHEQKKRKNQKKSGRATASLNWQDHGGAFSLGVTTSDYYAFVGRPANADGTWRYRIDTPYGALIDAGFASAEEAMAAAEGAMDDEIRSGLHVTASSLRSVASRKVHGKVSDRRFASVPHTGAAEVNVSESKDYKTGFLTYRAEIAVPGFDYSSELPMNISVHVEQFMSDSWSVMGVYGPYNSVNSKGKYSDVVLMNQFSGKKADAKRLAVREVKRMYAEWMSSPRQRTASTQRTASNEAEVDAFIATFPAWLRDRAEALKHRMVYGQDYSRGISDNLIDAARFASQGVDDSAEWYIRKAEAKEVALLGGEFVPAVHPGNEKTAGLSDLTYGPTQPDRNAGTRWEGVPTDQTGYSVIVLWPGDEVTLLSAVMRDYERAVEWAQMARSAGAVQVFVRDNTTGVTAKASLGQHRANSRRLAYGETKAPAAIDTLRARECPVCGEDESADGDGRCRVCGYLPPPEPFRDPDLDVAQKVDMRQGPVNIDLYSADPFLSPDEEEEDEESGNPVRDDQSPPKKQKNASQGDAMRPTIAAAARQQEIIKVQAQTIARMKREMNVLRRMADAANPAQPVAEPGAQAPAATTDQTRAADATIELTTPGGIMAAPMAGSFDLTTPGGVIPATPAINQEVTAPVTGYEQSISDMRTEVDVNASGETIGENYVKGDWANTTASRHQARTFASLRLARLRLQAGVERGDDIALAQRIASSRLSDEAIRNEINSLSKIPTVASRRPNTPIRQQAVRNVPSLVSTAAPVVAVAAPSMSPNDDEFLFS